MYYWHAYCLYFNRKILNKLKNVILLKMVSWREDKTMDYSCFDEEYYSENTDKNPEPHAIDFPGKPDILVVEDEIRILKMVSMFLSQQGFRCDEAASLGEAYKAFSIKRYAVIFLDINLPDGSGLKALRKALEISPNTLVIIMTGTQDLSTAVFALREGAYDYITKPFSFSLLMDRLNSAVGKWRTMVFHNHYLSYLERLVEKKTESLTTSQNDIEQSHDNIVLALGTAGEMYNPETENHRVRVSVNSAFLCRRFGAEGVKLRDLKWGAYLHDIGAIGIPARILSKPGPVTANEYSVIKKHSLLGYSLLKNIDFLSGASEVVLNHHEKYDGTGYPCGLEGKKIPLFARIFSVIDAFDAMVNDCLYRKAIPVKKVIRKIKRNSGTHFDPEIVKEFLQIPDLEKTLSPVS